MKTFVKLAVEIGIDIKLSFIHMLDLIFENTLSLFLDIPSNY